MDKRKISLFMAMVMAASVCVCSGMNVHAEEQPSAGMKSIMQEAEPEIGKRSATVGNEIFEFQDETMSRAYQIKVEALGEALFPEYAQKASESMIRPVALSVGNAELGDVIYSETKSVSDNETLTYAEYTSGRASLTYQKSWSNTSTSTAVSGGTQYRSTCAVTVTGCYGSVYTSGFTYTINLNNFDWIDSIGTCHDNFNMAVGTLHKRMEDGSPARATFAGSVEDMLFHYTIGISFEIQVGGNAARVYAGGSQI